ALKRTQGPPRLRSPEAGRRTGNRKHRPHAQAGADVRHHQEARACRRTGLRRRRAGDPARRLRLPAQPRHQLHRQHRRHLHLAQSGAPLQLAHRRHDRRRGPHAQGWRALLRADQAGHGQRRAARAEQAQGDVREPHAA
ncbi:MAG: Transcription termination factor Rho, partial [uncultured Ramlibacter sp.]